MPPSLRELVKRALEALDENDRALLRAASVAGLDFDTTSVAAATRMPVDLVELRCAHLASTGQLVRETGTTSWPDTTISATYRFLHGLHREAVYNDIPLATRARLHRAIAGSPDARLFEQWANADLEKLGRA